MKESGHRVAALKRSPTPLALQARYRYRLYPTPGQKPAPARQFGCCRVVWNDALVLSQSIYQEGRKYPGGGELQKRCITQAKRTEECSWLSEISASVLQQSVRDLDKAFRFGRKSKGKVRAPRFLKRSTAQSARIRGREFRTTDRGVHFPKVGELKLHWSRPLPSPSSSCTIIKDCAGRYFASFVMHLEDRDLSPVFGQNIGIGLGLASLAVTSDGEKIAPPKFLRAALKRLRRLQRNLKHKQRGSNRLALARLRVAKLHAKVAARRLDLLHKLSTRLIRENQAVCIEDLNVSGMVKNRKLSRAIADAGWRPFRILLEYKADLYGRALKVGSREPTSQVCSACGRRDGKKPLSVRAWTCPARGAEHDRDVNAAKNILAAGLAARLNGRGARSKTSLLAAGCETLRRGGSQQP